ncbi:MAG TPA: hypothetical protein VGX23_11355 [Actinocrinis sp.]|nr:hypothetical protein [Actinocrinis sp.]
MVDPAGSNFTDEDRAELRALGSDGYVKLLGTLADGDYPDPYGEGTTYYTVSGGSAQIQETGDVEEEGRRVWSADVRSDHYPDFADLSYLIDL